MAGDNVEVVRRWLGWTLSADPEAAKMAVAELCDSDVDYYPVRKLADTEPCHGREEFSQFLAGWLEAWSRLEWAVQDLIEVGDDRVLVCANLRAEGRGSGMKLEGPIYQCEWVRHGRLFRIEDHLTLSGALHALGLEGGTLEAAELREQVELQGNLGVARSWIDAYNRGDLEAMLAVTHPDFEFRTSGAFPDLEPVYQGHAGFQRFYEDFTANWESFSVAVDEMRLAGGRPERRPEVAQRALLLGMFEGRGRDGLEVRRQTASVWTFRDGLVLRIQNHENWAQAIRAVSPGYLEPGRTGRLGDQSGMSIP